MSTPTETPLKMLSLDEILAADDTLEEIVEVPEWGLGRAVRIRRLTREEVHKARAMARNRDGTLDETKADLMLLVYGVVEPKFEPIHVHALKKKSTAAIQRVMKPLLALNNMGQEGAEEAAKSAGDES